MFFHENGRGRRRHVFHDDYGRDGHDDGQNDRDYRHEVLPQLVSAKYLETA